MNKPEYLNITNKIEAIKSNPDYLQTVRYNSLKQEYDDLRQEKELGIL